MAITVHTKTLGSFYWQIDGSNLVLKNLVNRSRNFWAINPKVINDLSGNKSSTFSQAQLDSNFTFTTSSDISLLAENFADSVWSSNGWTVGTDATFTEELKTFISNNYGQQSVNANLQDMVVIISRGNVGGTEYSIPFCFVGNKGDEVPVSNDIYFNNVTALLHFDESSFPDSSLTSATLSSSANATFDTSNKNFGAGALSLDGLTNGFNSYLRYNKNTYFYTGGDFTIEFWVKAPSYSATMMTLVHLHNLHFPGIHVHADVGGYLRCDNGEAPPNANSIPDVAALIPNQWHHVACVKDGVPLRLFVDGIKVYEAASQVFTSNLQYLQIGQFYYDYTDEFTGKMDELRFTNGIARYTSNFIPPNSPF